MAQKFDIDKKFDDKWDQYGMEKVICEGNEANWGTGFYTDGVCRTVVGLHESRTDDGTDLKRTWYLDMYPHEKKPGKYYVTLKESLDCAEVQRYRGDMVATEFHNLPDGDDGPSFVRFGKYVLMMSADKSWQFGIAKLRK